MSSNQIQQNVYDQIYDQIRYQIRDQIQDQIQWRLLNQPRAQVWKYVVNRVWSQICIQMELE